MPTDFEELKRKLLQSDEEYRQLATQHHDLDEKIHDLKRPPRHEYPAGCPQLSFDLDRRSQGETLRARISKGSSVPIWLFCCFLATSDSIPPH
mgnify:CR=1 FL=1